MSPHGSPMADIVAHTRLTQDVVDAAERRQQILGDTPGWIAVHGLVGMSPRRCTCPRGTDCQRAGKHPVASLFPNGSRDAVVLSGVLDRMGPGMRLGAVLSKEHRERVLDADTPAGLASLRRAGAERASAWLCVRTPRGLHLWQSGVENIGQRGPLEHRVVKRRGLDVKTSGLVVWPDGRERWLMSASEVAEMLDRLGGGVVGHGWDNGIIESTWRPPDPYAETGGEAGLGPTGDPVDLHVWALESIRTAEDGARNDTLNLAAWRCRALIAYAEWPVGDVAESLYKEARKAGLEHGESVRTVRSGLGIEAGAWSR